MKPKLIVNGQEFSSVDEMPPEIRQLYEQTLARITGEDFAHPSPAPGEAQTFHRTEIVIDGRQYTRPEEMPPDVRRRYEHVLAAAGNQKEATEISTVTTEVVNFGAPAPAPSVRLPGTAPRSAPRARGIKHLVRRIIELAGLIVAVILLFRFFTS